MEADEHREWFREPWLPFCDPLEGGVAGVGRLRGWGRARNRGASAPSTVIGLEEGRFQDDGSPL